MFPSGSTAEAASFEIMPKTLASGAMGSSANAAWRSLEMATAASTSGTAATSGAASPTGDDRGDGSSEYGVGVVIGEITYNQVGDRFATIELDQIAVKGKTEAVTIFGLLGGPEMQGEQGFQKLAESHKQMLMAYRSQDFDKAEELCKVCRTIPGNPEVLYDLYDERIEDYKENPPGPDWDGVFVATSK